MFEYVANFNTWFRIKKYFLRFRFRFKPLKNHQMGRKKGSLNQKEGTLDCYIRKSPIFVRFENSVICTVCNCDFVVSSTCERNIKERLLIAKQRENLEFLPKNKGAKTSVGISKKDLNVKLCRLLFYKGVPFNFISDSKVREFSMNFGLNLMCVNSHRNSIAKQLVKDHKDSLFAIFRDCDFAIHFDESTDACQRYILNIMAVPLIGTATRSYLLESVELTQTNSANIIDRISFIIAKICKDFDHTKRLRAIISDGAAYYTKIGNSLKKTYLHLLLGECILHNLHNLAETIRNSNPILNAFIS